MKPNWHYYEAHVNLGEMNQELTDKLAAVLSQIDFKTTDIVSMPYDGLETEDFTVIITTKDSNLKSLTKRINDSVLLLSGLGYNVQRYKIESTIIDSKYEDKLDLLHIGDKLNGNFETPQTNL